MKNPLVNSRPSSLFDSPFRELNRMQREIDRLFDRWTPSMPSLTMPSLSTSLMEGEMLQSFTPTSNVQEMGDHYLMSFDFPGVKKEDIRINVRDNVLTVSGERKDDCEMKGKNHYHMEQYYGSFERSYTLPANIKPEQVEAQFSDGVLRIAVPRVEATTGQQIKIGEGKPAFWDRLLGHKKDETRERGEGRIEHKNEKAA